MKDFEMPPVEAGEEEELDLLAEEPMEEEESVGGLKDFSDDDLIEELKARGFEIEQPEEVMAEEEESEEVMPEEL